MPTDAVVIVIHRVGAPARDPASEPSRRDSGALRRRWGRAPRRRPLNPMGTTCLRLDSRAHGEIWPSRFGFPRGAGLPPRRSRSSPPRRAWSRSCWEAGRSSPGSETMVEPRLAVTAPSGYEQALALLTTPNVERYPLRAPSVESSSPCVRPAHPLWSSTVSVRRNPAGRIRPGSAGRARSRARLRSSRATKRSFHSRPPCLPVRRRGHARA